MKGPLKRKKALPDAEWIKLASIAEASIERFRRSVPYGLEIEDLKQDVIVRIPRLLETKPPDLTPDFYIYCRANYEVRRTIHKQRTIAAGLPRISAEVESSYEDNRPDMIDLREQLSVAMADLTPLTQTLLLLIYEDCTYEEIAQRLCWSEKTVRFIIERATTLLGLPDPEKLAHKTTERIKMMLLAGRPVNEIVSTLGCDKAKVVRVKQWLKTNRRRAA